MAEKYTNYWGAQKTQHQGSGTIPALADEELIGVDDEYDDLYSDVNVGENFFQAHNPKASNHAGDTGNGGLPAQKSEVSDPRVLTGVPKGSNLPGDSFEGKYHNDGGKMHVNRPKMRSDVYPEASSVMMKGAASDAQVQNNVSQGSTPTALNPPHMPRKTTSEPEPIQNSYGTAPAPQSIRQIPVNQVSPNTNANHTIVNNTPVHPPVENGNTMLFVGELHWWTTDSELESVLSQYGRVKEIKFFDERASGKSKGYCQVEFYDAAAASACKEGMNGYVFNGRASVVAFASPETLKQKGTSFMGRNHGQNQSQNRRFLNEGIGRGGNMNMQGEDGGRNYRRGGFGRSGQGMPNRGGPWGRAPMQGRGPNNVGNGVGVGPYGPGFSGHPFGGSMMRPQGMRGTGFDPTFMGQGGGYGGFLGLPFTGMPPSFPGVNALGIVGVAPHVNPAVFGRGMANNGLGMTGASGMDGLHSGMWNDSSGYGGEDGGSEYGNGDENQEKDATPSVASWEKERGPECDWSGNTDRKYRDEKERKDYRHHEEKNIYRDYRSRERDSGYENDQDRRQSSSRSRSRSRMVEDDHRSRSREADYGKRRHLPSD